MSTPIEIPASWRGVLGAESDKPYFAALSQFVADERRQHDVFPAHEHVMAALEATPYDACNVVLLGQDPYPTPGHAHGLCFSVLPGVKPPGSLKNMYKELEADLGCPIPSTGYLMPWAQQGILMLNAVLTVRAGEANSHKDRGWEQFTDAVIDAIAQKPDPVVFVLWGNFAQKKAKRIAEAARHVIIKGAHPSPLSAKLWFGSRPFSQINQALAQLGKPAIEWRLP